MLKKTIASNRKAKFEYFLLEHYEAGLVLKGSEIKSIRARQVSIAEAYIQIEGNQAWLVESHIAPYDPASRENHDPKRKRKLLLNKREIRQIWEDIKQKGLTVVPTEIYLKDGKAKIDPFQCTGCGACIPVCPQEAIDLFKLEEFSLK